MKFINLKTKEDSFIVRFAAYAAFVIPFFVMVIKTTACFLTGSLSVQASFIDSVSDMIASLAMIISVYISQKPANKMFQFGFGKVEALGALVQSVFLFASGIFVCFEAYESIVSTEEVRYSFFAVSMILISSALLFILTRIQKYVIKRTDSLIIKSSFIHFHMDILLDLGVLISLSITHFFGLHYIDSIFGLLFSLYIFRNSFSILMKSFEVLLDKSLSDEQNESIKNILLSHKDIRYVSDIKTRISGLNKLIVAKVFVDPTLSMEEFDIIKSEVSEKIKKAHSNSIIILEAESFKKDKNFKESSISDEDCAI